MPVLQGKGPLGLPPIYQDAHSPYSRDLFARDGRLIISHGYVGGDRVSKCLCLEASIL